MTEACAERIKKSQNAENFGVRSRYVPDRHRRAQNVKRAPRTHFGTLLKQYLVKYKAKDHKYFHNVRNYIDLRVFSYFHDSMPDACNNAKKVFTVPEETKLVWLFLFL